MQLLTQRVELAHSGFDQLQLVAQQLRHRVVRGGRVPQGGDAVADFAQGKSQTLRGFDVEHQLQHLRRIVAVTVGSALRRDQAALLVEAQGVTADGAGLG